MPYKLRLSSLAVAIFSLVGTYKIVKAVYTFLVRPALDDLKDEVFVRSDAIPEEVPLGVDCNDRKRNCGDVNLPKSSSLARRPKNIHHKADLTKPRLHWDDNWDGRKHMNVLKYGQKPTASRHYLLIRHGQYNDKVAKSLGRRKLTSLGRQQALITGEKIRSLGLPIDKVYSSTKGEAKETSCLIQEALPGLKSRQTKLLREGSFVGPLSNPGTLATAEIERFEDRRRIEEAFHHFLHRASPDQKKDSVEMYVCHRNVIHYFVCRALQYPEKEWPWINIPHCSMTYLTVRPDGTVLLDRLADIAHLLPDKVTTYS